jgi:hypothetical protein
MASQERIFFKSLTMPGNRGETLDAETILELMDWTASLPEDDMIGIKTSCTFSNNNGGGDLG